jgi:hypothetical protein
MRPALSTSSSALGFAFSLAVGLGWPAPIAGQFSTELEGAWRVVSLSGPGMRTVDAPQPGLLLFTGRHYSYTFVTSDGPRPPLPAGPTTPDVLVNVWNPFTANAGTFEIVGETMTRRPLVAKSPDAMAPGAFNEYRFRLVADTLWITPTRTEAGDVRAASTVRYVRVP